MRNYRTGLFRKTRFRSGLGRRTRRSRLGLRHDLGFHDAELLDQFLEARPGVAGALTALVEPAEEMRIRARSRTAAGWRRCPGCRSTDSSPGAWRSAVRTGLSDGDDGSLDTRL